MSEDAHNLVREFIENYRSDDRLMEMATLRPNRTNLPVIIYVDDSKSYLRGGHSKRIKFQANRDTTRTNSFSAMTLDGEVVKSTLPVKHDITQNQIKEISNFVKNNFYALDAIADMRIDIIEFSALMIKKTTPASQEEIETQKRAIEQIKGDRDAAN